MLPKVIVISAVLVVIVGGIFLLKTNQSTVTSNSKVQNTESQQTELVKVSTAFTKFTPSEPVMLLAKKLGIDKKNGLDIEMVESNPGDVERELIDGKYNIIWTTTLSTFAANKKGIILRVLAPAVDHPNYIIVPTNSTIKKIADLKGKRLATLPVLTTANASLKGAGLDTEKDLKITFAPPDEIMKLLATGEVDAGFGITPLVFRALGSGQFRLIADLEKLWEEQQGGLHMPFVSYSVRADWYKNNKDTARKFVQTYYQTVDLIKKDPNIIAKELPDYIKQSGFDDLKTLTLFNENFPTTLYSSYDELGEKSMKNTYDRAKEYGIIPSTTPPFGEVNISRTESGL